MRLTLLLTRNPFAQDYAALTLAGGKSAYESLSEGERLKKQAEAHELGQTTLQKQAEAC